MMNNVQLLAVAKKYLGKGGAIFRKYCGLGSGQPYCCAYVTYIFHEGGDSSLFYGGKKVVYCPSAIKWCEANLALVPPYLALPMDIIFFDWNNNSLPDHIGFVKERKSCDAIYTIEGNTSGGIVDDKLRNTSYVEGIYRPHFPAKFDISKPLEVDGLIGYSSIAMLQKALGGLDVDGILGKATVKKLQAWAGTNADGAWGKNTSKAIQRKLGVTADGYFGANSCKALQRWCNSVVFKNTPSKPVEKPSQPTTNGYQGTIPSIHVTKSVQQVINDSIKWGKWIASDNSFHYGCGKDAHHNGCYFCGTQPSIKKKSGIKDWQKTYCCNPFVHACFAHGGLVPAMLSKCAKGSSYGFAKNEGYATSNLFKRVYNLQAGDVLCSDSHVALYIGNGKVVQASGGDDNVPYSTSWNKSISVGTWKGYKRVYRLVKGVDADVAIRFGEYSDRVKQIQKFLNWYNGKNILAEDGIFGEGTEKYVKAFQTAQHITADGIIGNGTLAKMKGARK